MTRASKIRWFVIVTLFYWICLFTITHIPQPDLPDIEVSDKLIHYSAYALLAIVVLSSLNLMRPTSRINESLTLCLLLFYGGFDERTQPFFNRTCDIHDWLADAARVATAEGVAGLAWAWWRARRATTVDAANIENDQVAMTNK